MGVSGNHKVNTGASEAPPGASKPLEAPEVPDHPEHAITASQADTVLPMARRPGRPPGLKKTGGRRKGVKNRITRQIKELALPYGKRAFTRLAKLLKSDDDKIVLAASREILDRAYGRPQVFNELTGPGGTPLIETPADPLEVARRVAFLLDQGVRAKAGTMSATDTDDGETPPPTAPVKLSPHERRNFSDPELGR